MELESEYYGVKLSFAALNDGRFVDRDMKLNEANLKLGKTDWEVKYVSDKEWRNKDYLNYQFQIYPDDGGNLERDMKNGIVLENSAYTAFLSDEIGENKCKVTFVTDENSFLDGRMKVVVDLVAYKGFMSAEDFKAAAETFIYTLAIEILDKNAMNDAEGNFPNCSGVFTVPAKLTIDGRELETGWTIKGARARAAVSFTDAEGQPVTIVEEGKNVAKYVSSRYDDEVHYRHVQFGDYIGICDMDTGKGNLDAEYTIVFERDGDKETNMTFSVIEGEKGALSYQAIRDLFADDAQVAELNARLDAYAAEYLSQIVYHGAA